MKNLGPEAADARIVFISVDPHRDTPDKLQAYVDVFNKNAIGLTGTESQITDVARRYRVAYQIEKPTTDNKNDYVVSHSRGVYVFDQQGSVEHTSELQSLMRNSYAVFCLKKKKK